MRSEEVPGNMASYIIRRVTFRDRCSVDTRIVAVTDNYGAS